MKIDILDIDKLIGVNHLEEVTSPRLFSNQKMIYDPSGILSNEIFGISKGDRRSTFAYIDLKRIFIHPHIYAKVLKSVFRSVINIVNGSARFSVKDGVLMEDDNGWTGLQSFYDHWDEIDWSKLKSTNTTVKNLLMNINKERVFVNKILVCPPAYRDVMISGTMDSSDHVSEVNTMYCNLIRSVALLSEGGTFARIQYAAQKRVQETLVEIMNYFKKLISKKHGLIRKNLIGKSVDFGVRTVISAPTYNHNKFEDNIIDIEHTGLPIYECCSTYYPFIEAWMKNFFNRDVVNGTSSISLYQSNTGREVVGTVKDPDIQFSEKNIHKLINDYLLNPDNRFKIITIDVTVPTDHGSETIEAELRLKGKVILENNAESVINRPMTITDLLYLACVDVCEHRHCMVSRYPVGTDKGIYFCKIRVLSTIRHVRLIFNGKEYPFYPDIDLETPSEKVGVTFIDTLVMSNSHLEGMGGDYDGDQVSVRGIWSDEANLEAEEIMNRKMSALNITGNNAKVVSREVFNSLFELTKNPGGGKPVSERDAQHYLGLRVEDITLNFLTNIFADTVDATNENATGKRKSHYNAWDTISIPANYFYEGQSKIDTTIGRFIFNKFVLEGSGLISITKFVDYVLMKSTIGNFDDYAAQLYMEDEINRKQFNSYIDRRDTLGYWLNGMLAHTISEKMLKPLEAVEKRKAELCKKYEKELASGNIDVMTQISDQLIAYAKEILKDDPGMDLYNSGDLDFGNNYKNNSILKGAVMNKITNEFDFIASSFMNGIEIKDIPAHANSILASQYPASIATEDAGYLGKKLLALLQMMEIDEPGTDCGTKQLMPIKVTKHNKNNLIYTYIDVGGQLVMLTRDNVSSYIGKTVMMRSPMSCLSDKICSKCAGNLFYLLGAVHAGLFAVQISHADLNLGLKAKHDSTVNLYTLNPDDLVEDII